MNRTENISNNSARLTIALCGNPNSGKTTLFNVLTGSNQKVGNWPGVTVEQKTGFYKQDKGVAIVDTPGIYSLSPFTVDEQVAHDYLFGGKPDLIINIVDSTNLERNLFLTTQLAELDIPMVVALNMLDEAEQKVDDCKDKFEASHIKRLASGQCSADAGAVWLHLVNDLERVGDHIRNLFNGMSGYISEKAPIKVPATAKQV